MLHFLDLLHKVAVDMHGYSGTDPESALEEFFSGNNYRFTVAITDDVEDTELLFLNQYGTGRTFYFRMEDYATGKAMADNLHYFFTGGLPDDTPSENPFGDDKPLYLFLHVRPAAPVRGQG